VSILVTPLARTVRPSGDTIDPALVEFKFERRGLSATVRIDVREARELARIMTAAAGAAESLEPVVCMAEVVAEKSGGPAEPPKQPAQAWAAEALAELESKGELRRVLDQPEDGGGR
jgi:hypothetical protein